jgi:hypothetical protein
VYVITAGNTAAPTIQATAMWTREDWGLAPEELDRLLAPESFKSSFIGAAAAARVINDYIGY